MRWMHTDESFKETQREWARANAKALNTRLYGYPNGRRGKNGSENCINCGGLLECARNSYCRKPACRFIAQSIGGTAAAKHQKTEEFKNARRQCVLANPAWTVNCGKPWSKRFNSKGELELKRLIEARFPNHKWQSGGNHKIGNGLNKAHDIYCTELKLIVEYDGIYHWKDVHGNLKLVQAKDKQLELFCKENGWKLIRVNEKTVKKIPLIVETIFNMIENLDSIPAVVKLYLIPEIAAASAA